MDVAGRNVTPVRRFPTKAKETAINAMEPVMTAGYGNGAIFVSAPYVIALTTGFPTRAPASNYFIGIAAAASSHSSSADGYVDVYLDLPGTVYGCKAKVAANMDTQSEIDAKVFYRVGFDLTASTYTIDVAGNANAYNLVIVGGDPNTSEVHFMHGLGTGEVRNN